MDVPTLRDNIDTIFIVMLENRSFDCVLGHQHGVPDVVNLSGRDAGRAYHPKLVRDRWITTDLPHGRDKIATALGGPLRGFVKAFEDEQNATAPEDCPVMWHIDRADLPITDFLAQNYRVCKRWFASLPCDTFPNRLMAMSGTSWIDDTSGVKPLSGKWLPNQPYTTFDFAIERIRDREPFKIYVDWHSVPKIGYPTTFYLMPRLHSLIEGREGSLGDLANDIKRWDRNATDVEKKPPGIVYIEPFFNDVAVALGTHGACNHPPLPMAYGEAFLRRVYAAVTSNPEIWKRSLMIVYYDEHGGFFDHVLPPHLPASFSKPAGASWIWDMPITTFGLRVPAILVSPWANPNDTPKPGNDDDIAFDHTSVLQLLVERFGEPDDLAKFGEAASRKAAVGSVREALSSTRRDGQMPPLPDAPTQLPVPAGSGAATEISAIWAAHLEV